MEITKEALAKKLHDWLEDVDGRNDLDWYEHVVERDFKCGCRFDNMYGDGVDYEYCKYWAHERHKIVDVVLAENMACDEKERRYQADWNEAIRLHRMFCDNENLYKSLRLAGETMLQFVERIAP